MLATDNNNPSIQASGFGGKTWILDDYEVLSDRYITGWKFLCDYTGNFHKWFAFILFLPSNLCFAVFLVSINVKDLLNSSRDVARQWCFRWNNHFADPRLRLGESTCLCAATGSLVLFLWFWCTYYIQVLIFLLLNSSWCSRSHIWCFVGFDFYIFCTMVWAIIPWSH